MLKSIVSGNRGVIININRMMMISKGVMKVEKMIKTLASMTICLILLVDCPSNDPVQKIYDFMDRTLSIMEANKGDPPKAADEVGNFLRSVENELDNLTNIFEIDKEKSRQLAERLKPLFEKQERILRDNPGLKKNVKLQQALIIFEVLSYSD